VKLPLRVAVAIVNQGIRIRLGRSVVTLLGVTLGIAFLMSTLTTELLRRGVADEDRRREAANRRYAALVSETGPLHDRRLGLVVTDTPDEIEVRLLRRIEQDDPKELRLRPGSTLAPGTLAKPAANPGSAWARGAAAVLVLGGAAPSLDPVELPAAGAPPLVAHARRGSTPRAETPTVELEHPATADELRAAAEDARRIRFRATWIIVISLFVTVIGIANSMLMSVTERFRDIGTMRCLGALSSFVRTLFLVEAAFMGVVGGALGALAGALFTTATYLIPYGGALGMGAVGERPMALMLAALATVDAGLVLTLLAALYTASTAARKVPADALRSTVCPTGRSVFESSLIHPRRWGGSV
jgi:hypothetical protein